MSPESSQELPARDLGTPVSKLDGTFPSLPYITRNTFCPCPWDTSASRQHCGGSACGSSCSCRLRRHLCLAAVSRGDAFAPAPRGKGASLDCRCSWHGWYWSLVPAVLERCRQACQGQLSAPVPPGSTRFVCHSGSGRPLPCWGLPQACGASGASECFLRATGTLSRLAESGVPASARG